MPETAHGRLVEGRLVLVVGPSGVGKDSLIAGARARLADDPQIVFPRRDITRPADAGGEDHAEVSLEAFAERRAAGGYALSWGAHGLWYGVPASIRQDLSAGRTVVVNVSRSVLTEARAAFPGLRIVSVTAPAETLVLRLAARGRESPAEVADRVRRAGAYQVEGADVVEVANDGDLDQGVQRFLDVLAAPG